VRLSFPRQVDKRRPTAIDLFAGAGGTSLGLDWAGFDVRAAVEIDRGRALTFASNQPHVPVLGANGTRGDVRGLSSKRLLHAAGLRDGELDLLVGCPPCQGFSLQGSRDPYDERNYLYKDYLGLVRSLRPRSVGFENVPGILTLESGAFIGDLLSILDGYGYRLLIAKANAARFGVPQERARVFVLGYLDAAPPPPNSNLVEVSCFDAIADLPTRTPIARESNSSEIAYKGPPLSNYAVAMRGGLNAVTNCELTHHSSVIETRFRHLLPGDFDPTTRHRRLVASRPAFTITAGTRSRTACRPVHPVSDRVLTVREAARLSSFPDSYRFPRQFAEAWSGIGSAVPPLMARDVFRPMCLELASQ
jgi:DNA (cytosine-5)-methyltransferase 1